MAPKKSSKKLIIDIDKAVAVEEYSRLLRNLDNEANIESIIIVSDAGLLGMSVEFVLNPFNDGLYSSFYRSRKGNPQS